MKKTKSRTTISVLLRVTFFPVMSLFLLLCPGCADEPQEDISISEITVYNIPAEIPVFGKEDVSSPAFKIYLYASDSQSELDQPAAKGTAKISEGVLENGTYSVTIKLQNPNSDDHDDPNEDTGPWSGTANYFSIMISPKYRTSDGVNAVWIKGGTTFNKGKKNCDWESLMDFRGIMKEDPQDTMEFGKKSQALYDEIILKDNDIKDQQ